MKILVAILLLANLSVFVWHFRWSEADQPGHVQVSAGGDPATWLVLAREQPSRPASPPVVTAAVVAPSDDEDLTVDAPLCYSLGPFERRGDLARVQEYLAGLNIPAERRVSKDNSRQGFWVYLPPAGSQEARDTLARLKQEGVTDYFRVATGEQKDAISLGVFSRSDLAQRRLRAMRKQGFQPQLETVPLPRRLYWLDWPVEGNSALNAGDLGVLQDQHAGIDQWEQACAQP